MEELLVRMHAHFAAEETDYFRTLGEACPRLCGKVATLTREHQELLHAAQRVLAAFERDDRNDEVRANLSSFIDRFLQHEEEENLLLQEFIASENAALEGAADAAVR